VEAYPRKNTGPSEEGTPRARLSHRNKPRGFRADGDDEERDSVPSSPSYEKSDDGDMMGDHIVVSYMGKPTKMFNIFFGCVLLEIGTEKVWVPETDLDEDWRKCNGSLR